MNIPGTKLYQRGTPILLLLNLINLSAPGMPMLTRRRCQYLLEAARGAGLPVAHALDHAHVANENARHCDYGMDASLRPKNGEMIVARSNHSCFSNEPFASLIAACN